MRIKERTNYKTYSIILLLELLQNILLESLKDQFAIYSQKTIFILQLTRNLKDIFSKMFDVYLFPASTGIEFHKHALPSMRETPFTKVPTRWFLRIRSGFLFDLLVFDILDKNNHRLFA